MIAEEALGGVDGLVEVRCVACGDRWTPVEGGPQRCTCALSVAGMRAGEIELHGPIEAVWRGEGEVRVTAGTRDVPWPQRAPLVRRKALPPLL